jgi:hypothetical protein
MGCCGRRPVVLNQPPTQRVSGAQPFGAGPPPNRLSTVPLGVAAGPTAQLRYLKQGGVIVHGPVTGKQYVFPAAQPVQQVAAADAAPLLRTAWFRRA